MESPFRIGPSLPPVAALRSSRMEAELEVHIPLVFLDPEGEAGRARAVECRIEWVSKETLRRTSGIDAWKEQQESPVFRPASVSRDVVQQVQTRAGEATPTNEHPGNTVIFPVHMNPTEVLETAHRRLVRLV